MFMMTMFDVVVSDYQGAGATEGAGRTARSAVTTHSVAPLAFTSGQVHGHAVRAAK
jgi:hypothetical protein